MRIINGKRASILTWIVLLTVIFAVFSPILVGLPKGTIEKARRKVAMQQFSTISYSYVFGYLSEGYESNKLPKGRGDSAHAAAYFLARDGQLNDASLYFVKTDPLAPAIFPQTIFFGRSEGFFNEA